jgi:hypothetical protein
VDWFFNVSKFCARILLSAILRKCRDSNIKEAKMNEYYQDGLPDNVRSTKQTPMTTDQISKLFNMHPADLNFARLVADVRLVERHHGIGEE